MLITLDQAKEQLNILSGDTSNDNYINRLISVAEYSIQNYLNTPISGYTATEDIEVIKQAVLIQVNNLFMNRESLAFTNVVEVPYTLQFLLSGLKNYVIV